MLADSETDIFDGLIVDTPDGDRFVDAPHVDELYERAVVLNRHDRRHDRLPPTPGLGPDQR